MKLVDNKLSWLVLVTLATVAACANQGPFEEAGEEIDEAADEVEDAFD